MLARRFSKNAITSGKWSNLWSESHKADSGMSRIHVWSLRLTNVLLTWNVADVPFIFASHFGLQLSVSTTSNVLGRLCPVGVMNVRTHVWSHSYSECNVSMANYLLTSPKPIIDGTTPSSAGIPPLHSQTVGRRRSPTEGPTTFKDFHTRPKDFGHILPSTLESISRHAPRNI
jgi:hypothetical protein